MRTKLTRADGLSRAVGVAESVSHALLEAYGFRVAEAFCVVIDEKFASSLTAQCRFDNAVLPGRHWGTRYIHSAQGVEFSRQYLRYLQCPMDLFRLYLADVILANPDRRTHGNVLLVSATRALSDIIPIDQSEAFFGPSILLNNEALRARSQTRRGKMLEGTDTVIFTEQDPQIVEQCFCHAKRLLPNVGTFVESCPEEWFARSGVDIETLRAFIEHRIQELDVLARKEHFLEIASLETGGSSVQSPFHDDLS